MARYDHRSLKGLEKQLLLSPAPVRRKHADRLEAFLLDINPESDYSLEFIYYRITGFRPTELPLEIIPGNELRLELQKMLEEVSSSAPTPVEDVPERVYSVEEIADRYGVSERTVYRWRKRGLFTRKYQFPHGREKVGVREEALERFVQEHHDLVERSADFSPLADEEEARIRSLATNMGENTDLSLTAAAERIADEIGRATETVRRILREDLDETPFQNRRGRLKRNEKQRIYDAYDQGEPVSNLGDRFDRSRSSIYRIVNEQRARQLLDRAASLSLSVESKSLEQADEEEIFNPDENANSQEALFRLYHFLFQSIRDISGEINPKRYVSSASLDMLESRMNVLDAIRHELLARTLPVIVEAARSHSGPVLGLPELVEEGCLVVLGAVERFDYSKPADFQRFARLELMKTFARTVPADNYRSPSSSPGSSDTATDRNRCITALTKAARRLNSLQPQDVKTEKMSRVMQTFGLQPGALTEELGPAAEALNLNEQAITIAVEKARESRAPA